jgi:hypothetical protein
VRYILLPVKVSSGHNFINLISDYSFLFPGMIKYQLYFVNISLPGGGIPGLSTGYQEQRDAWSREAVPVQIRSFDEKDCSLPINSTLMKGQGVEQPLFEPPKEGQAGVLCHNKWPSLPLMPSFPCIAQGHANGHRNYSNRQLHLDLQRQNFRLYRG